MNKKCEVLITVLSAEYLLNKRFISILILTIQGKKNVYLPFIQVPDCSPARGEVSLQCGLANKPGHSHSIGLDWAHVAWETVISTACTTICPGQKPIFILKNSL